LVTESTAWPSNASVETSRRPPPTPQFTQAAVERAFSMHNH
jgi:hypothetical protein